MSIIKRAYAAVRSVTNPDPPPRRTPPQTIDHALHYLWSERVGSAGYDAEEKRLWMCLQRFVERKGGLDADIEDYRA